MRPQATNAMRLMNFTQDRDLLQVVRLAAPGEASTAVLFTASYPDGGSEQVSMGNDVQMYVRLAVKNLRRFGHRPRQHVGICTRSAPGAPSAGIDHRRCVV